MGRERGGRGKLRAPSGGRVQSPGPGVSSAKGTEPEWQDRRGAGRLTPNARNGPGLGTRRAWFTPCCRFPLVWPQGGPSASLNLRFLQTPPSGPRWLRCRLPTPHRASWPLCLRLSNLAWRAGRNNDVFLTLRNPAKARGGEGMWRRGTWAPDPVQHRPGRPHFHHHGPSSEIGVLTGFDPRVRG